MFGCLFLTKTLSTTRAISFFTTEIKTMLHSSTVNNTRKIIFAHAHLYTAARLSTTFTSTFIRSTRRTGQTPTRTKSTWSMIHTAPSAQCRTVWPIGQTISTCTSQVCPRCQADEYDIGCVRWKVASTTLGTLMVVGTWTGFTQFTMLSEKLPDGYTWSGD